MAFANRPRHPHKTLGQRASKHGATHAVRQRWMRQCESRRHTHSVAWRACRVQSACIADGLGGNVWYLVPTVLCNKYTHMN